MNRVAAIQTERSAQKLTVSCVRLLAFVTLVAVACSPSASNAPSPTVSVPAISTATVPAAPSQTGVPTATAPGTPTPTPIGLPTTAMISAPSSDLVWMLVGGTRLFRSADRGTSWNERGIPAAARFGELAFANDRDGLLISAASPCEAQQFSMWATHDGASTWDQITPRGITDAGCKIAPSLVEPQHAFLTTWAQNMVPAVYSSVDGGLTWSLSRPLPDPPGFPTTDPNVTLRPGAVHAFGSLLLLEINAQKTSGGAQFAYRSTDGGASWSYASTAPMQMPIAFVMATRWLQVDLASDGQETTDGGATWHTYPTNYRQAGGAPPQIVFGDANIGYATSRGGLQRTVDGGAHWTALRTPGTPSP